MKLMITMKSEEVNNNSLLVTNPLLRKDIVKDVIGSLPNILTFDIGVVGITPPLNYTVENEYRLFSNREYHFYDIHDISKPLIKLVETDVTRYECEKDKYDLSKQLPSMKIYYMEFSENIAFCNSIFMMIENYYKYDSGVEIVELKNELLSNCENMQPLTISDMMKTEEEIHDVLTELSLNNDPNVIGEDPFFAYADYYIFKGNASEIQLDETAMSDKILSFIRSKFSVIVPEGSNKFESTIVDENKVVKHIIDTYAVYAMDSTKGLIARVFDITSSDFNYEGVRTGTIRSATIVAIPKNKLEFSNDMVRELIERYIEFLSPRKL